jgi:hypothetical protein
MDAPGGEYSHPGAVASTATSARPRRPAILPEYVVDASFAWLASEDPAQARCCSRSSGRWRCRPRSTTVVSNAPLLRRDILAAART